MQAQLIEDLLDMSRISSGKMRLDIQAASTPRRSSNPRSRRCAPRQKRRACASRRSSIPRPVPSRAIPSRLQQIVWNLLSNAIKFTPKGGRVQVRARARRDVARRDRGADTGCGIEPEFLPFVFERFRQADAARRPRTMAASVSVSPSSGISSSCTAGRARRQRGGGGKGATFTVGCRSRPCIGARRRAGGCIRKSPAARR